MSPFTTTDTCYARLDPDTFAGLDSFCYVSYSTPGKDELMVLCTLLPSGFWSNHPAVAEDVSIDALTSGVVSQDEALSGVATYVGRHVLIPMRAQVGRVWSYYLVCGSDFESGSALWFALCADSLVAGHPNSPERRPASSCVSIAMPSVASIVIVDLVNLCMQPDRGTNVMMRSVLLAQYSADKLSSVFNGFDRSAKRDLNAMLELRSVLSPPIIINEYAYVPFLNLRTNAVAWQLIRHVMDFAFYALGQRATLGDRPLPILTLSVEPVPVVTARSVGPPSPKTKGKRTVTFVQASPQKSKQAALDAAMAEDVFSVDDLEGLESDDDDVLQSVFDTDADDAMDPMTPPPKRAKTSAGSKPANQPSDGPNSLSNERSQLRRLVDAMSDPDKDTGRGFKTTSMQTLVFENISNGKCASGVPFVSPQQWVESLQSLEFGLVWYPSFCCGMYSFEFSRTISIASLSYDDWLSAGLRGNTIDMADFSRKAKKHEPPVLRSLAQVSACVGQLYRLALRVFKPRLASALDLLRQFLVEQEANEAELGPDPVAAIVVWVDNRLYALRNAFASNSPTLLKQVIASFDTVAKEYRRVLQVCEAQKWKARDTGSSSSRASTSTLPHKDKDGAGRSRDNRKHFGVLLRGMPKLGDTPVCFTNLSAKTCTTKDCKRSHDLISADKIKGDVLTSFKALYGPLRSDLP